MLLYPTILSYKPLSLLNPPDAPAAADDADDDDAFLILIPRTPSARAKPTAASARLQSSSARHVFKYALRPVLFSFIADRMRGVDGREAGAIVGLG